MNYIIGFIGGGNMSTAIAKGILDRREIPPSQLWVSGPNINSEQYKHWKVMHVNSTTKNGELYCNCDIVFLGVKPHLLHEALVGCLRTLSNNEKQKTVVVSMLAGITIDQLDNALRILPSEKKSVIRIMPNTPMMVGHGACMVTPGRGVAPEELETVIKLLSCCGVCKTVPEQMIDSLGALTACGPAFMYIIIEALADGAVKQGVPRAIALTMAAQTVIGSGEMVLKTGKHPGLLKDEVCSPGGSTICGVTALEDGKVRATMIAAIEAATKRMKELGK